MSYTTTTRRDHRASSHLPALILAAVTLVLLVWVGQLARVAVAEFHELGSTGQEIDTYNGGK